MVGRDEATALFGRMAALSDPLRARMLLVLERVELTVNEASAVFQLPQSTMSRQLRSLAEDGWLGVRAEGTSRFYRMRLPQLGEDSRRLWRLAREGAASLTEADEDRARVRSVLHERRTRGQAFFSGAAGEWDRIRRDFVGRRLDLLALLGLLDESWVVGDLGCGTGQIAEALAPFVRGVVGVDESPEMLETARRRLAGQENVELRGGSLEALPLPDLFLDAAVVFLVLHYIADPPAALREIARVLRPGGRLLIADLTRHDREEYRATMGHSWLGFEEEQLGEWCAEAGFDAFRFTRLPVDAEARGPALFVATACTERERPWMPGTLA